MKAPTVRYLNEIVGLTLMASMAVALIAGEADATGQQFVRYDRIYAVTKPAVNLETRDVIRELIRVKLHKE